MIQLRRLVFGCAVPVTALFAQGQDAMFASRGGAHVAFVRAFNEGTSAALGSFVRDWYRNGAGSAGERAVSFWQALRLEVGPLELVGPTREVRPNRTAEIFWYRGLTTGAYPGIELTVDTGVAPRVTTYGVNRALRPAIAAQPAAVAEGDLPLALDRYFRAVADSGHFSGAVVVARGGRTLFAGAYGPADFSKGRINTLQTPYALASVTKLFTGVAILQLAERGRLSLSDPVSKFIPEYPADVARQVTVRHLLTHTSGIELDGDSVFMARVTNVRSVSDLVSLQIERLPHVFPQVATFRPLDRYDYTNEGIDLLGAIVERASGQKWSAYLAENVFRPAGMQRSGGDFLLPVQGLPVGYSSRLLEGGRSGEREVVPQGAVPALRPAGTGYASAPDLVAFIRALNDETLLRQDSWQTMMTKQVEIPAPPGANLGCRRGYGFTMVVTQCDGRESSVGHGGSHYGQSTVVSYFPASGTTVVILSNFDRVTWWAETHVLEMLGLR